MCGGDCIRGPMFQEQENICLPRSEFPRLLVHQLDVSWVTTSKIAVVIKPLIS